jgi:hypothetical protein
MSDNVGYTPGSGATIAADNIGGALHQRVKVTIGPDGVNDGDVSATNPLPTTTGPLEWFMRQIRDLLMSPRAYDSAQNRMRQTAIIESGTVGAVNSVGTVTAVADITRLNGFGALPAEAMARHQNLVAWASVSRGRII